jgi:putative peptidoglycan lipid II flippase
VGRLLQNLFFALHETRYPARVAAARVAVSAALGAGLMIWLDRYGLFALLGEIPGKRELRLGAVGLALGSAVGGWVELTLLLRGAGRRLPGAALPWRAIGRMGSLAAGAALPAGGLWWAFARTRLSEAPGWLAALAVLVTYAGCYLGGAAALGFPELRAWLGRLR